jgi:hypothetical protein
MVQCPNWLNHGTKVYDQFPTRAQFLLPRLI